MAQSYSSGCANVPFREALFRYMANKCVSFGPPASITQTKPQVDWFSRFWAPFLERFALCYQTVVFPACL